MNISFIETKNNCALVLVKDFYSTLELEGIKSELHPLYELGKLQIFNNDYVAKNQENEAYQKSTSFFLDIIYNNNRQASKILTINRKLFEDENLKKVLLEKSLFFNHIFSENCNATLLNYYKTGDFYKTHKDFCYFTAITFFTLEAFDGGGLFFPEHNVTIEPVENTMIIFPGFMLHNVSEVKKGVRVSMSQFIGYNNIFN